MSSPNKRFIRLHKALFLMKPRFSQTLAILRWSSLACLLLLMLLVAFLWLASYYSTIRTSFGVRGCSFTVSCDSGDLYCRVTYLTNTRTFSRRLKLSYSWTDLYLYIYDIDYRNHEQLRFIRLINVGLPFWILQSICAITAYFLLRQPIRRRRKRIRQRKGLCIVCGYNLTGNTSGTCPECETPVGPKT